jgi:hypothetical protein
MDMDMDMEHGTWNMDMAGYHAAHTQMIHGPAMHAESLATLSAILSIDEATGQRQQRGRVGRHLVSVSVRASGYG